MAGQRKFPKDHAEEEEESMEDAMTSYQHPVQPHPFGRIVQDINAVVIEPSRSNNKFRLGNYSPRLRGVGALAGPQGLLPRQISQSSVAEVGTAGQGQSGLVHPYPVIANYHVNYPRIVHQNYVQHMPQYQTLNYTPWFMGK